MFLFPTEPRGIVNIGLLFLTEVDEMKGPIIAASSVVMMPSPIFLWRFKVIFFVAAFSTLFYLLCKSMIFMMVF